MIKPQLAVAWTKPLDKLEYPCIVEPKLDGVRCLVEISEGVATLYSRTLEVYNNFQEIKDELESANLGDCILDGEIVALNGSFDDVSARARSTKGTNTHINCKYYVFDVPSALKSTPLRKLSYEGINVESCDWLTVHFPHELETLLDIYKDFEGVMVKPIYANYRSGRNQDWKKIKKFHTADLTITGMLEGKGKASGMMGKLRVSGYIGDVDMSVSTLVGTGFSDELRQDMWTNKDKYIGKIAEIQYQEITKAGSLRIPSFKRMRVDLND